MTRVWLGFIAVTVLIFLLVPVFIVVPMSFSAATYLEFPPQEWSLRWYQAYFGSIEWMAATRTVLAAAVATVIIATPIGFAGLLHRQTPGRPAECPVRLPAGTSS